mgnify:CR=1 FL=1
MLEKALWYESYQLESQRSVDNFAHAYFSVNNIMSLVRLLCSSCIVIHGQVCNYPFTTRGISMGHIFINMDVYQVLHCVPFVMHCLRQQNN